MHMNVLIVGASGMLGHMLFRFFLHKNINVYGLVRNPQPLSLLIPKKYHEKIITSNFVNNLDELKKVFEISKPNTVINCVGLVKQLERLDTIQESIRLNSLFPHELAKICKDYSSRMIHVSTDCVFSGGKGGYLESDFADSRDIYGLSKLLGEVNYEHCLTLRTSIIGTQIVGSGGLLEWFLHSGKEVFGYKKALFSGLTTLEVAKFMYYYILEGSYLSGTYHLAGNAIDKFSLLQLINAEYAVGKIIVPNNEVNINRSLIGESLYERTGYRPPSWNVMIKELKEFNMQQGFPNVD